MIGFSPDMQGCSSQSLQVAIYISIRENEIPFKNSVPQSYWPQGKLPITTCGFGATILDSAESQGIRITAESSSGGRCLRG